MLNVRADWLIKKHLIINERKYRISYKEIITFNFTSEEWEIQNKILYSFSTVKWMRENKSLKAHSVNDENYEMKPYIK